MSFYQVRKYIKHRIVAKKSGFGIHSPFVFDLINNVIENNDIFYGFDKIEELREELLKNDNQINIKDLGAGSKKLSSTKRKISDIAKYSLKNKKQAMFLFRLANFMKSKTIIELGTSLGTTTLYLSLVNSQANIYTIEGAEEIYNIANKNIKENRKFNNISSLHGNFNEGLPDLLSKIKTIDFAFIDGNHTKQATINYFNLIKEKTNENSVIIFDDIYWSKGMTEAWTIIKNSKDVVLSIDLFHLGLVFFKEKMKKQDFKLFSNNL